LINLCFVVLSVFAIGLLVAIGCIMKNNLFYSNETKDRITNTTHCHVLFSNIFATFLIIFWLNLLNGSQCYTWRMPIQNMTSDRICLQPTGLVCLHMLNRSFVNNTKITNYVIHWQVFAIVFLIKFKQESSVTEGSLLL